MIFQEALTTFTALKNDDYVGNSSLNVGIRKNTSSSETKKKKTEKKKLRFWEECESAIGLPKIDEYSDIICDKNSCSLKV